MFLKLTLKITFHVATLYYYILYITAQYLLNTVKFNRYNYDTILIILHSIHSIMLQS